VTKKLSDIILKPLYVNRPLENQKELQKWAEDAGFETTSQDMHVTLCFTKNPVDWDKFTPEKDDITILHGDRSLEQFGDAYVLTFESSKLKKQWKRFIDGGAIWKHENYQPHVTISYSKPTTELNKIKPYQGELIFGPEIFKKLDENWKDKLKES
jgi:hypothetical protein